MRLIRLLDSVACAKSVATLDKLIGTVKLIVSQSTAGQEEFVVVFWWKRPSKLFTKHFYSKWNNANDNVDDDRDVCDDNENDGENEIEDCNYNHNYIDNYNANVDYKAIANTNAATTTNIITAKIVADANENQDIDNKENNELKGKLE
ncbi:unnamed protein product [Protopolystoma xenopodis]|uniref:Uncharacterized protein n=1 Tax=Protopolystoma xenopodis TaxID=117903 RepID=A0A448XQI9_9PLAT|nr:unnamed protein product [Protopolystoma xenopodis]